MSTKQLKSAKKASLRTQDTAAVAQHQEPFAVAVPRVPWSPWVAVVYAVIVYFAAQIIAGLIIIIYPHLHHWDKLTSRRWLDNSVLAQFWYVLLAEALTIGAIAWFVKKRGSSLRAIGWRRIVRSDIGFGLLAFAAYFVIGRVLLAVAVSAVSINVNQPQDIGFQAAAGFGGLALTFVSLVLLPPLVEETVFRGFVFGGLRNKLPLLWAAVGTSLLFASAHLQFGSGKPLLWVAAIDTFTLSMVLCYVREKTGSLWAGIFVHALKNGLAFASLFLWHLR